MFNSEMAIALMWASVVGLGVARLIVTPSEGPPVFVRERILRPALKRLRGDRVLDCTKCCSVWSGGAAGVLAWWLGAPVEVLAAAVTAPLLLWAVEQRGWRPGGSRTEGAKGCSTGKCPRSRAETEAGAGSGQGNVEVVSKAAQTAVEGASKAA